MPPWGGSNGASTAAEFGVAGGTISGSSHCGGEESLLAPGASYYRCKGGELPPPRILYRMSWAVSEWVASTTNVM